MDITELLKFTQQQKASDLHISAQLSPMIRVDGAIKKINLEPLTQEKAKELLFSIMNEKQIKKYENDFEVDFAFDLSNVGRFRANIFRHERGIGGVFRSVPNKVFSLEELQCPPILNKIANLPRGLVLVTGPTGSGKSTTLASMINLINATQSMHILTIEDPIEFVHKSNKSLINQREVLRDTNSFATALRSALREDPDVILVGELRDLETIKLALTAAETGHLVFATLHTTSAAKTIDRIVDVFQGDEKNMVRTMLSESLKAVISQTLIPKKENIGGRVAAYEIMLVNSAIKNLIRENKLAQIYSIMQTSKSDGMVTMEQSLKDLVEAHMIDMDSFKKLVD